MGDIADSFEKEWQQQAPLREAQAEIEKLRKTLYMCAASCQGGHSDAGQAAAGVLGIPFPVRMENLEDAAKRDGFDPGELWPWYYKIRRVSKTQ